MIRLALAFFALAAPSADAFATICPAGRCSATSGARSFPRKECGTSPRASSLDLEASGGLLETEAAGIIPCVSEGIDFPLLEPDAGGAGWTADQDEFNRRHGKEVELRIAALPTSVGGVNLQTPSPNFARVLILIASAVYGTNFAAVKLLDERVPFAVSAALRFGLAAAAVSVIVLKGERQGDALVVSKRVRDERTSATIGGMEIGAWYCLGYLCQAAGLQTADASKSAFFNALAVMVVPLLDSVWKGKRMGIGGISSVVLAVVGVGLLQLGPSIMTGMPFVVTRGDAFCLGQAVLFGIGYWRLEDVSGRHATQAGRVTMGQLLGVALGSAAFCGLTSGVPTVAQLGSWLSDEFVLGALLWTALVSTALALYLETVALKAVSAAELTVLMTSISLFGSAFAYVTMGETMSLVGAVGGLLILAGCVLSSLGEEERPMEEEEVLNEEWLVDSYSEDRAGIPMTYAFASNATIWSVAF